MFLICSSTFVMVIGLCSIKTTTTTSSTFVMVVVIDYYSNVWTTVDGCDYQMVSIESVDLQYTPTTHFQSYYFPTHH